MTTLKVLKLVDSNGHPRPVLEELVFAEGERRRNLVRGLLEDYYKPVFALDLSRATRNQFHEAFRSFGAREGVLTKCEAFFIRAAQDAGIQLSQYILAGRHRRRHRQMPARSGNSRGRSNSGAPAETAPTSTAASPASDTVKSSDAVGEMPAIGAVSVPEPSSVLAARLNVAELILSKYPDFDPSWSTEVQAKWMDGMTRLYEGLGAAERTESAGQSARPDA